MNYVNILKVKHLCLLSLLLLIETVSAQTRVIDGEKVDISQRPYQAAVYVDGYFNGGGVIISPNHILTAAHVVCEGLNAVCASRLEISVGFTNLKLDDHKLSVNKVVVHSGLYYDYGVAFNDVAVLELSEPLIFSRNVQSIPISSERSYETGQQAMVSGWGRIGVGMSLSESQLYAASVIIQSCNQQNVVTQASNSTAYKGDSGGPLTIVKDGRDVLIGLVSWGNNTFPQDNPSYYVNVGIFRDWILKNSIFTYITLTGPTQVCTEATFTLNNLPVGATVHWNVGGGRWNALELVSGQGTAKATYSTAGNGQGTVQATVNYLGASTTLSQAVWAGAPSAEFSVNGDGIARASACLRTDPQMMHAEPPVWQLWNPSQHVNFVVDDDGGCGRVRGAAGDWNIRGTVTVRNGCGEDSERFSMSGTSQTDPCPRQLEQRGAGSNLTVMYTKPIDCPVWPIRGAEPPVTIEVYDRMGRLLLRHQGEQVSMGSLRPGLYIVRARSGEDVATLTVVRE